MYLVISPRHIELHSHFKLLLEDSYHDESEADDDEADERGFPSVIKYF
jgi:hypothetical protein